jgi:hypothetical protein
MKQLYTRCTTSWRLGSERREEKRREEKDNIKEKIRK